jgi:hypothetical protein
LDFSDLDFFLGQGFQPCHQAPVIVSRERRIPENSGVQQIFDTTFWRLIWCGRVRIFSVMTTKPTDDASTPEVADATADGSRRDLSPAARRALAEAAARRAEIDRKSSDRPEEVNGRGGPDPTRYGDWEVKGLASDF